MTNSLPLPSLLRFLPLICLSVSLFVGTVFADITAENTIVVVNDGSVDSKTIANHYAELRGVPTGNVIHLSNIPEDNRVKLSEFRQRILSPILEEIAKRNLASQVRLIAYSADFPLEIDISDHRNKIADPEIKKLMTPIASINGATFHFRHLIADSYGYLSKTANLYSRMPMGRYFANPFAGQEAEKFESAASLGKSGDHQKAGTIYGELFDANPQQHPVALLAARHHWLADQPEESAIWLTKGMEAGWVSGDFLTSDRVFSSILESDPKLTSWSNTMDKSPADFQPGIGFRGDRVWAPNGVPVTTANGVNYLLSCCLAVTGKNGMTVEEAVAQLERSAAADYQHPKGEFLFAKTSDKRSTTRSKGFPPAIKRLAYSGHRARTLTASVPQQQTEIAGLMLGTASFDFAASGSKLLPGAIAENLTSWGGSMAKGGQTKLTALLKAGAAMSSGTVTEPYANQLKFPHPIMHACYAEGLTAVESFYSSIDAPYQLLIAGDPLCKPFAPRPRFALKFAPNPSKPSDVHLIAALTKPLGSPEESQYINAAIKTVELSVNGNWVGEFPPHESANPKEITESNKGIRLIQVNLKDVRPGVLELRATVVYDNAIESRQTIVERVEVRRGKPIPIAALDKLAVDAGTEGPITVQFAADGAGEIQLRYFGKTLATTTENVGRVVLEPEDVGHGPIRVQPVAIVGEEEIAGKEIVVGE